MSLSNVSTPRESPPKATHKTRHAARELSLQVLFQWDFHGMKQEGLTEFWNSHPANPEVKEFAEQLIQGVQGNNQALDDLILQFSTNWTIDRMPIVDRNILRQALYELLFLPEVPAKVSLNEALQLAKQFADEEAKRFINGILDQVLKHDARLNEKRQSIQ